MRHLEFVSDDFKLLNKKVTTKINSNSINVLQNIYVSVIMYMIFNKKCLELTL